MDAHRMLNEHHNRWMKKARVADARLHIHMQMHRMIPERVIAFKKACLQPVMVYGNELGCALKVIDR